MIGELEMEEVVATSYVDQSGGLKKYEINNIHSYLRVSKKYTFSKESLQDFCPIIRPTGANFEFVRGNSIKVHMKNKCQYSIIWSSDAPTKTPSVIIKKEYPDFKQETIAVKNSPKAIDHWVNDTYCVSILGQFLILTDLSTFSVKTIECRNLHPYGSYGRAYIPTISEDRLTCFFYSRWYERTLLIIDLNMGKTIFEEKLTLRTREVCNFNGHIYWIRNQYDDRTKKIELERYNTAENRVDLQIPLGYNKHQVYYKQISISVLDSYLVAAFN